MGNLPAVGEFWDLYVPFVQDPTNGKKRPCLVIGVSPRDGDQIVLLTPCTSQTEAHRYSEQRYRPGFIEVSEPKSCGLDGPTLVMARRVLHADPRNFMSYRFRGDAPDSLIQEVLTELGRMF